MTALTVEQVRAIRERAEKAPRGPWFAADDEGAYIFITDGRDNLATDVDPEAAKFIAAARTDVPDLCDTIEALRAALAAAEIERRTK